MATLWDEALLRLQDVQEKMQAAYDEQLANARDKGALLVEHAAHELNDQIHLLRIEAQAQAQHAQERLEEEQAACSALKKQMGGWPLGGQQAATAAGRRQMYMLEAAAP